MPLKMNPVDKDSPVFLPATNTNSNNNPLGRRSLMLNVNPRDSHSPGLGLFATGSSGAGDSPSQSQALNSPFGMNFGQGTPTAAGGRTSTPTTQGSNRLSFGEPDELRALNHSGINTSFSEQSSFSGPMRSSSRAHKGPYTRPSSITPNQNPFPHVLAVRDKQYGSTSRYTPYARKPISLPAKKLAPVYDPTKPHLSTTAQKMLDILQRNSTPVVEGAKKISLNQLPFVKALKPSFPSIRSSSPQTPVQLSGPPIKRHAPDFDLYEPSKRQALEPKKSDPTKTMVDSSTNTTDDLLPNFEIAKDCSDCKSKFKFRKAWNIDELYDKRKSESNSKPITKPVIQQQNPGTSASGTTNIISKPQNQSPVPNGPIPFSTSTTFSSTKPSPMFAPAKTPPAKPTAKWSCETCLVQNEQSEMKCVCCEAFKPGTTKTDANKPTTMSTPIQTPPSKPPGKWSCETCLVQNEQSEMKCVCCESLKPGATKTDAKLSIPKIPSKKWNCTTCMVPNELNVDKCVCCESPNPNPVACDNVDAKTASAPILPKPGSFMSNSNGPTTATPTSSTFTFGFSKPPVQQNQPAPTTIATATPTNQFSFGLAASKSQNAPTVATPTNQFSFGLPPTSKSQNASPVANGPVPSSTPASFSSTKPTPVSTTAEIAPPKPGLFSTSNGPTPTTNSFSFGTSAKAPVQQNSPAPTPAPPSNQISFGLPASKSENESSLANGTLPFSPTTSFSSTKPTSMSTPAEIAPPKPGLFSTPNGPTPSPTPTTFAFGTSFGKPPVQQNPPAPTITAPANQLTFGSPASSMATTTSSTGMFSFAQPQPTTSLMANTTTSAGLFAFGQPQPAASSMANSTTSSGVFSFGQPQPATSSVANTTTSAGLFGFGQPQPQAQPLNSGSIFGNSTGATTNANTGTIGAGPGPFFTNSNGPTPASTAFTSQPQFFNSNAPVKPTVPTFESPTSNNMVNFPVASSIPQSFQPNLAAPASFNFSQAAPSAPGGLFTFGAGGTPGGSSSGDAGGGGGPTRRPMKTARRRLR